MWANASMLVKIRWLFSLVYSWVNWGSSYILPTDACIDRFAFVRNPFTVGVSHCTASGFWRCLRAGLWHARDVRLARIGFILQRWILSWLYCELPSTWFRGEYSSCSVEGRISLIWIFRDYSSRLFVVLCWEILGLRLSVAVADLRSGMTMMRMQFAYGHEVQSASGYK